MTKSLSDMMDELNPEQRRKVDRRAEELIKFHDLKLSKSGKEHKTGLSRKKNPHVAFRRTKTKPAAKVQP